MAKQESQYYENLILECDRLIKAGQISIASQKMTGLNLSQVPRPHRHALAKICRRVGLVGTGLRLLYPVVRNEKPELDPPNPKEICEYAVLLSRNGSIQEALTLLKNVDGNDTADAFLYSAYCHISNWEYEEASALLEKYLNSPADDYAKLIARVNLAAAYIALSYLDKADELLRVSLPLAEKSGAHRLVGNLLELRSRVHIQAGHFSKAKEDLDSALRIFGSTQIYDRLFIYKWQAVIKALEDRTIDSLIQFRAEALSNNQWESVREADLFTIKTRFDQKLLDHLTYGTPMIPYRKRIQNEVGGDPSETFILGDPRGPLLDLSSGDIQGIKDFNPGKKIHRVLSTLLKDFYVPRNTGTLFADLYPEEYFDINSSPLRIRQLLLRTRNWIRENKIPISIKHLKGTYGLFIQGPFGFQIPLNAEPIETNSLQIKQLKKAFPEGAPFTAREACEKLGWPRSTFLVVADQALKSGSLEKSGTGKSTVYKCPSSKQLTGAA